MTPRFRDVAADRGEVGVPVGQIGLRGHHRRERRARRGEDRVAVGLGLGHVVGAEAAAAAGLVHEDDRRAEQGRELRLYDACGGISRAAGRERNDELDRAAGVRGLGRRSRPARIRDAGE
jgi:hypothetical protein